MHNIASMPPTTEGRIQVLGHGTVAWRLLRPADARALLVLAHGAGTSLDHAFLEALSRSLSDHGVATFRYNFPYREGRGWPPDRPPVLQATVRAAVARAAELQPELPLLAGGKSLGGRMTSSAAAKEPLPGVRGLVFVGFPLHPRGKPATKRADHLADVGLPMLFLQGTRDRLAELELLRGVVADLQPEPTLHVVEGADHGFGVLKRSGRTEAEVVEELARAVAGWSP